MTDSNAHDIRFIDSDYKTLFTIPDGGYITITTESGEELIRKCKFLDETHISVGGYTYHIAEFAERMEQNGSKYAPCPSPEIVGGYTITDRTSVNDKVFALAHNPDAVQKFATWQGRPDRPGYDLGHYFTDRSEAWGDYFRRADAERTGRPYDFEKEYKQPEIKKKKSNRGTR